MASETSRPRSSASPAPVGAEEAAAWRHRLGAWLAAIILVCGPAAGLEIEATGRPPIRTFSSRDGLPQSSVTSLAFDRRGFLWAGTYGGPATYDGPSWRPLQLPNRFQSSDVRAMLESADGSFWFGTFSGGLARRHGGRWTVYDTSSGLPDNRVRGLVEVPTGAGATDVWVATLGGVARWGGAAFEVYRTAEGLPSDEVWCLLVTRERSGGTTLWAGTSNGLARWADGRWTADGGAVLAGAKVLSLLRTERPGGEPVLWAGTEEHGLARSEGGGAWAIVASSHSGLPSDTVSAIAETVRADGSRDLWAGTWRGLVRFDSRGSQTLGEAAGLPSIIVRSLAVSPRDPAVLWIATDGGGVARLLENGWLAFDRSSGLAAEQITAFAETVDPDGTPVLWVGTDEGGLSRFDPRRGWRNHQEPAALTASGISTFFVQPTADGRRRLWVGTDGAGLALLDGGTWRFFDRTTGLPGGRVWDIVEAAPEGRRRLFVGLYGGGLAALEDGRWQVWNRSNSPLPDDSVWELLATREPDGTEALWIGTAGGGLARWAPSGWTIYDTKSGLPSNSIWALADVKTPSGARQLWVGTDGAGLARFDFATRSWSLLADTSDPALPSNFVYEILQDARGDVYVLTARGVVRLRFRLPGSDGPELVQSGYTVEDGLPSDEGIGGAGYLDRRGRLWFGTIRGAARFDSARETLPALPVPISLAETFADRETVELEGAELPYTVRTLKLRVALPSYRRESQTRFRTQLEGLESAPTEWTADGQRSFTNLAPGNYRLLAWGRDGHGLVSGPLAVPFLLRPAPWQTWWARLAMALAALGAIYLGLRLRTRTLEHRAHALAAAVEARTAELSAAVAHLERSEQVARTAQATAEKASQAKGSFLAMMSHEIRTPLNSVLGMAQLLLHSELRPEQRRQVEAIGAGGELLLGILNDVLDFSKIEAGRMTLEQAPFDLPAAVGRVLEMFDQAARAKGLRLELAVGAGVPVRVIGDSVRLRQILANLVSNGVKFTAAGTVSVRLDADRLDDGRHEVRLAVRDTGIGIPAERVTGLFESFSQLDGSITREYGGTGLGLAISLRLCELMGGAMAVESKPGRGSTFSFTVPMAAAPLPVEPAAPPAATPAERVPGLRILVVEDVPTNQIVVGAMLDRLGWTHDVVASGEAAVAACAATTYDVVLMDVQMPGMSGLEATRRIRERSPAPAGPRIVALTAGDLQGDREACLAAGMDGFLAKPIRLAELREAILASTAASAQTAET